MSASHSDETASSKAKNLTERIVQLLTALSIVIGLPVAIVQGRPTSTVTVLVIVLLCLITGVMYLWRRRLPSGQYKYDSSWRWFTTTAVFVVFASLIVMFTIPPSRAFVLDDVLGFTNVTATGEGITVAESADYYRAVFPIYNPLSYDQVAGQMTLTVDVNELCNASSTPYEYSLKNQLAGSTKNHVARGTITPKNGVASGFSVLAAGTWYQDCNSSDLSLTFAPPGLVVQKSTTTLITVDIPKQISAIGSADKVQIPDFLDPASPDSQFLQNVVFALSVNMVSGPKVSACTEFQAGSWNACSNST